MELLSGAALLQMGARVRQAAQDLLGVPYLDGGRSEAGADCWGLVRLLYARAFGIALPSYAEDYSTAHDRVTVARLIEEHKIEWERVESPQPGDVVVIRIRGRETHVAVYLGAGEAVATDQAGPALIRLEHPLWSTRIVGFYRHPLLSRSRSDPASYDPER